MKDLRHKSALFAKRQISHWTPQYISNRLRLSLEHRRHPEHPDLTRESIHLLARLLRKSDRGAEWGSGNSTGWFAERTEHLLSFETNPAYYPVVRENLRRRNLTNVDLTLIEFKYGSEEEMHGYEWLTRAEDLDDSSLDYALVDSAPRGCICNRLVSKIKQGGLLILDNANWYIPPPHDLRPVPASSVQVPLGFPGSREPEHQCWPEFLARAQDWRKVWTSNGVTTTLIMVKA